MIACTNVSWNFLHTFIRRQRSNSEAVQTRSKLMDFEDVFQLIFPTYRNKNQINAEIVMDFLLKYPDSSYSLHLVNSQPQAQLKELWLEKILWRAGFHCPTIASWRCGRCRHYGFEYADKADRSELWKHIYVEQWPVSADSAFWHSQPWIEELCIIAKLGRVASWSSACFRKLLPPAASGHQPLQVRINVPAQSTSTCTSCRFPYWILHGWKCEIAVLWESCRYSLQRTPTARWKKQRKNVLSQS